MRKFHEVRLAEPKIDKAIPIVALGESGREREAERVVEKER